MVRIEDGRLVEEWGGPDLFDLRQPPEITPEDVPLGPDPADTGAEGDRDLALRGRARRDQRAPAGGGWKPKRLNTVRPCALPSRSRKARPSAGCLAAATTAPGYTIGR